MLTYKKTLFQQNKPVVMGPKRGPESCVKPEKAEDL